MTPDETLILQYYEALNERDPQKLLALLHDEIIHEINQGQSEIGREAFGKFLARMNRCYHTEFRRIVTFTSERPGRVAAEYVVHGTYLEDDEDQPPAAGQTYTLAGGAFFECGDGKISRITNYYNVTDWLDQVSSDPLVPEE